MSLFLDAVARKAVRELGFEMILEDKRDEILDDLMQISRMHSSHIIEVELPQYAKTMIDTFLKKNCCNKLIERVTPAERRMGLSVLLYVLGCAIREGDIDKDNAWIPLSKSIQNEFRMRKFIDIEIHRVVYEVLNLERYFTDCVAYIQGEMGIVLGQGHGADEYGSYQRVMQLAISIITDVIPQERLMDVMSTLGDSTQEALMVLARCVSHQLLQRSKLLNQKLADTLSLRLVHELGD